MRLKLRLAGDRVRRGARPSARQPDRVDQVASSRGHRSDEPAFGDQPRPGARVAPSRSATTLRWSAGRVLRRDVLAALRPSEAVDLRQEALSIPKKGWRELYLSTSAPSAGRSWSESGTRREHRRFKHRGVDEIRIVPSPPELTAILRGHLAEQGTTPDVPRGSSGAALGEPQRPRVGRRPHRRAHERRSRFAPRSPALRPPARRGVHVAQRRGSGASDRGVGRAQRRRPAPRLRQVRRRAGGRCATPGGTGAAGWRFMIASVMRPWIPVDRGSQRDTAGRHENSL